MTLEADVARARYQKIHVRFASEPGALEIAGARVLRSHGRSLELVVNGHSDHVIDALRQRPTETLSVESLTLEEIFVSTLQHAGARA
jgi:hypothetical protein